MGGPTPPWAKSPGVGGAEGGPEEMRDHTASPRWAYVNKSGKAQGPDLLAKDPIFSKNLIGRNTHKAGPARSGCYREGRGGRQQWAAAEHCSVHMRGFYFVSVDPKGWGRRSSGCERKGIYTNFGSVIVFGDK